MKFKTDLSEEDRVEALIHGTGLKIGRIHVALVKLSDARRVGKWVEVYFCCEDLWKEVEAYLLPEVSEDILPLWKTMSDNLSKLQIGGRVDSVMGDSLLLEIKVRRVLARLHLDMKPEPKIRHLMGAMG